MGDLRVSALRNDIRGRQDADTADIASDASSIASVSAEQLVDTRSGRGLSPGGSTVRLPEELILPTLRPKKRLTNAQLRGKLPFTLWRLVNEDQVCLRAIQLTHYGDPPSTVSKDLCCSNCNPAIFTDCEYDIRTSHSADIAKTRREPMLSNIQKWFTRWAEARY
jgi:hypothetical protein